MSLVNTKQLLIDANKSNYAVGAFNFSNLEQIKSILLTANKLESPVILSSSPSAIRYMGLETIVSIIKSLEKQVDIDFSFHLDHGKTFKQCKDAIDAGYPSVMIDGSTLSYQENIKLTSKVVNYAKKFCVSVEGELGVIGGKEDDINNKRSYFTQPDKALDFVKKTNVDSLAISIGTRHGAYKYNGDPFLDFQTLNNIKKNIPNTPLVLHGASSLEFKYIKNFNKTNGKINSSSGITKEILKDAINLGISKINIDTDLRITFTTGVREILINHPDVYDLRKYLNNGYLHMSNLIKDKIKNLLNSYKKSTYK